MKKNKIMKRTKLFLIMLLIGVMVFAFAACGGDDGTEGNAGTDDPVTTDSGAQTDTSSDEMIDGTFGELSYQIKNYRSSEDRDDDDNEIEYYLEEEGGKIQIASNDRLISVYKSPEEMLKADNKEDAADLDVEEGETFEVLTEQNWSNGNGVSGYQSITMNVDEEDRDYENKVAIFTNQTCYILSLETDGENQAAIDVFNALLETVKLS